MIKLRFTALLLILLVPITTVAASAIPFGHSVITHDSGVTVRLYDVPTYNEVELADAIREGEAIVFYGNASGQFHSVYNLSLTLSGETDDVTNVVANGVWLQGSNRAVTEHVLVVKDYEATSRALDAVHGWIENVLVDYESHPDLAATRTMVEFHEPYGVLETMIELLRVNDTSKEYDWYDVTVSQDLTPGANSSGSDWEWNKLTYIMNGSMVESNVFLSDYDKPPTEELPTGLFSFLWRIIRFDFRRLIPWFHVPEITVEGVDMSDFSRDLFMVQYRAPDGFQRSHEPLRVRHHYVLRVENSALPRFWQGAQAMYLKGSVIAGAPYYAPLMGEGYLELL